MPIGKCIIYNLENIKNFDNKFSLFFGFCSMLHSRFAFSDNENASTTKALNLNQLHTVSMNRTESNDMSGHIIK